MASTAPLVSEEAPRALPRGFFAIASLLYLGLALAFLPWAREPARSEPYFVVVWSAGIFVAEACITALFAAEYRRICCRPLLIVTAAYLFSACMVLAYAVAAQAVLASESGPAEQWTAAWLFLFWRTGTALLLFIAAVLALRPDLGTTTPKNARSWTYLATTGAIGASALITALVMQFGAAMDPGSPPGVAMLTACLVLHTATVALIWGKRAFDDLLFLWIALTLVAALADLILSAAARDQFVIGWAIGKSGSVVAAYMLLAFLLMRASAHGRGETTAAKLAAYGGALAVMCAAMLIRWCLAPWMGGVRFPYETLFGAIAIAVWLGGWKPAALAALVGYAASSFWLSSTAGALRMATPAQGLGFALYLLSSTLIIVLGERMRRARDRYKRAEARFRSSQEASLQGFSLLRPIRNANGHIVDFRFEYVNPTGARMAKAAPADLIGKSLSRALPSVTNSLVFENLKRVAETGVPVDIELEYRGDGIRGWFRNMAVRADGLLAVSYSDITRSKVLETELKQRAEELQRADTNKSQFLALLSHELRNPLAPIRNGLALLKKRYGAEDSAGIHAMMERQMRQLTRLIDDLLDLSRIDRGKLDLHREKLSVEVIVHAAVETARPNIEAKSQRLRVRPVSEPLWVEGDPVRLAQVISNLLNNAAKFTSAGGCIEIETRAEAGNVVLCVRDTGIGLAPEHLNRIFDMFVQVDSEGEQTTGGLGLGLTLVRSIVALHGGSVEARSAGPGRGSEFIVRLPLVPPPAETSVHSRAGATTHRQRILVVDDNADAAASLGALLRLEGHDVATACDGHTALEIGAAFKPDAAFVDLNMPGMDGIELARHLRARPWAANMRLVAVTGMGRRSDIERTRAAGFHAHLTKPASLEDLLAAASGETQPMPVPRDERPPPEAARR